MNSQLAPGLLLASLLVSVQCNADDHFLKTREPGSSLHVYVGGDLAKLDGDSATFGIPVEARYVTRNDLEIAVRKGASSSFDGSTSVAIRKGRRPVSRLTPDFISIEGGYVFDRVGTSGPSRDVFFTRARAQGGFTRLGYDVSVTLVEPAGSSSDEQFSTIYSVGYRSQVHADWHLGFDFFTRHENGSDGMDPSWADVVLMKRSNNGSALYAVVEKRLAGDIQDWYAGIGYEFRFDLR